jgi:NitT/TauT family transport system substrate-binding protein
MRATKRAVRLTCLLAATAMATTACASAPGAGNTPSTNGATSVTAVGGGASLSYTVPQLMDTWDMGKEHGLDLTYTAAGTSSTNMIAAVLSGEADFAFPASTTAIDAIQGGGDVVIVASGLKFASILGLGTEAAKKVGVSADAPVNERIAALRGLTIATSPEGSGNNSLLRQIVSAAGLDPDKDLKVVGVQDPSAIVGGIKQGRFDAGFYGSGVIEANIAAGEAQLWISTARGDVTDLVGDQMGMVMVTSKRTLNSKPDLVSRMFDTVVATEKKISDEPEAAGDALKANWFPKLEQNIFDLAWGEAQHAYPADGLFTEDHFNTLVKLMSSGGKSYSVNYSDAVYDRAEK